MSYSLGIDIGGTSVKLGVVDREGNLHWEDHFSMSRNADNQKFGEHLKHSFSQIPQNLKSQLIGSGVCAPSPLESREGILLGYNNIAGLDHFPIKSFIQTELGIPSFLQNDANAAAIAEYIFGEGKACDNLLVITLGTGLGSGWVINGELFTGWNGNGMELGHITVEMNGATCGCGQKGCVEAYFSTRGFLMRMEERGIVLETGEDFFSLIRSKNPTEAKKQAAAIEVLEKGISALGEGIRSSVNLLNCTKVILVGGLTKSADLYLEKLNEAVNQKVFPVFQKKISIRLGKSFSGIIGAGSLVFGESSGKLYFL